MHSWRMHFRDQMAICDWTRKKKETEPKFKPRPHCLGNKTWPTFIRAEFFTQLAEGWLALCHNFFDSLFLDFLELPLILYCYSHVTCTSTGMQRNLLCKLFTSLAVEGNNGKWWGIYSSYFYCSFLGCSRKMSFLHTISNKETGNENHSVSQSVSFFFFMWM